MRARSRLIDSRRSPIICYVTDRRSLNPGEPVELHEFVRRVEAVSSAGVDWIQIREKGLSARELTWLARQILRRPQDPAISPHNLTRIIVNDRLDVALAERAGGVHLAENSLPVIDAKRLAETRLSDHDFLVGVSCHSLETARRAESDGADYLFFGPVFATPSKAQFGAPQGLEQLAAVCVSVSISVIAIGGITVENARPCMAAGAAGIAAIRLFQEAGDVNELTATLRERLNG